MNKNSSTKSFLILIVVIAVSAIGYFYLQGTSPAETGLLEGRTSAPVSAEVIALLNQIQSLRIDATLFKDASYLTLRDYEVPIPDFAVGRTNPFAPVPGMPSSITSVPRR